MGDLDMSNVDDVAIATMLHVKKLMADANQEVCARVAHDPRFKQAAYYFDRCVVNCREDEQFQLLKLELAVKPAGRKLWRVIRKVRCSASRAGHFGLVMCLLRGIMRP